MSAAEIQAEARRVLGICNACGYCNGFCDLFEAARRRPALTEADLIHLANLCHACRNCYHACQYAPPHVFAVNVPHALARMRHQGYRDQVWPRAFAPLLDHPHATVIGVTLGAILLVLALALAFDPDPGWPRAAPGPGAFYHVLPWEVMVGIGLLPLGWSALALGIGWRRYWRLTHPGSKATRDLVPPGDARLHALVDILKLRNLRGGGVGCNDRNAGFSPWRRWLHQVLLGGLALSLAATLSATLYHHGLGLQAPYPFWSAPVLLGTLGGSALLVATAGLAWIEWRADPAPLAPESRRLDCAFLWLLFVVASSGLALLVWRETPAMPLLLIVHLGAVLAFFLLLPYSKFVHSGYRAAALALAARDRHAMPRDRS
ncbi:tricarballylate utilization 4Fe-4S protein TcuB [Thermochromatium tepidum]|uniref:Tricarballylate utilization 4Fe-4S protein TcuB n=1 Tax=Thermochromatium tepidum ATCC 43061 TaxID=316276 RepID=A0A6I6E784_THETI|nr:tricarballylate utilization 4Fe-4S protein TcuB [Thermochromatium tepidum]QGU32513.1 tricarballylate utilization 4Fe-4S protein TcuB [Thermochromatium tepidum ATCC 43061]